MNIDDIADENVILLLGSPRSGTTWLAKILDSHPDVLYRHEPDTIRREPRLQCNFESGRIPAFVPVAQAYLRELIATRELKSAGPPPIFAKSFRSAPASCFRRTLIYCALVLENVSGFARWFRLCRIPDMINPAAQTRIRLVIKSIVSARRARLFAEALPGCRIVYIVREPLGQVASMRRGLRLGKFERATPLEECLTTEQARRYGLTAERFAALPELERLAWHWALLNEKAIADLAGLRQVMTVRYRDLCDGPIGQAKAIFAFAGLAWNAQTERFVRASTTSWAPDRYYQVFKNTRKNLEKWRSELMPDESRRVMDVVRTTVMADFCRQGRDKCSD